MWVPHPCRVLRDRVGPLTYSSAQNQTRHEVSREIRIPAGNIIIGVIPSPASSRLRHPKFGVLPSGAALQAKRGISRSTDLERIRDLLPAVGPVRGGCLK